MSPLALQAADDVLHPALGGRPGRTGAARPGTGPRPLPDPNPRPGDRARPCLNDGGGGRVLRAVVALLLPAA